MPDRKTFKTASDRLKYIVDKKFETCFIFPLSQFEETFGDLWGHGLKDQELTKHQKIMKEQWEQVRINILNKGNMLRRSLSKELDLHTVKFNGYHMEFRTGVKK